MSISINSLESFISSARMKGHADFVAHQLNIWITDKKLCEQGLKLANEYLAQLPLANQIRPLVHQ